MNPSNLMEFEKEVLKVKRITPKGYIVLDWGEHFNGKKRELRFSPKGSHKLSGYNWLHLIQATEPKVYEIQLHNERISLIDRLKNINLSKINIEVLRKVVSLLSEKKG